MISSKFACFLIKMCDDVFHSNWLKYIGFLNYAQIVR